MTKKLQKLNFLIFVGTILVCISIIKQKYDGNDIKYSVYYGQGLSILEQQRSQFSYHGLLNAVPLKIRSGETLTQKFNDIGMDTKIQQIIIDNLNPVFPLSRIRAGKEFILLETTEHPKEIVALKVPVDKRNYWILEARNNFQPQKKQNNFTRKLNHVDGVISSTFYESAQEFDIPIEIFLQYIRLMSFDISFQQDIRKNTEFSILYEELYDSKGDLIDYGNILKAGLRLYDNREFTYYMYQSENNATTDDFAAKYYARDGRSSNKLLMKTPLDGSRISSNFGRRRHPIRGYTRKHNGIDFAAPTGTPIYAAGSGKIIGRGYNRKGYGRYLIIQHNKQYSTLYGHMNAFGNNVRNGARVTQQHIIGYVGSTGLSTGPHLHYEIRKNGKAINPLRTKFKSEKQLKNAEFDRLLQTIFYLDHIAEFQDRSQLYNVSLLEWLNYRKSIVAVKTNRF